MFETKVDERIQNLAKTGTDSDKEFLEDARKEEICSVIDSLSEDDFISLQKSIMKSFDAVQVLFDTVKGEIEHKNTSFTSIFCAANAAYLESSESSFYFKSEYVRLLNFLDVVRKNSDVKEEKLLEEFKETIERPFFSTKDEILKAIFTRSELKERVVLDAEIQDAQKINMLNELCEKIRKIILDNTKDEELAKSLRETSPSQIRNSLIIPICYLKNHYLSKPLDKNLISSVLDTRKKCIEDCNTNFNKSYSSIKSSIEQFDRWRTLSWYDDALEQLIKVIQESVQYFDLHDELNILQQIKDSSKKNRRKFYSGKKITYKQTDGNNYDVSLVEFRECVFTSLRSLKKESIENINKQAIDGINSEILKMEEQIKFVEGEITDNNETTLENMSIDEIMEDIQKMLEYISLDGIFFKFFREIARGESKEKFLSGFEQKKIVRKPLYTTEDEFMKSAAQLIWNTPKIKCLIESPNEVLDFYGHQLDLYSQFLNKRRIGEDDVIDAVIGAKPPVYQKGTNN